MAKKGYKTCTEPTVSTSDAPTSHRECWFASLADCSLDTSKTAMLSGSKVKGHPLLLNGKGKGKGKEYVRNGKWKGKGKRSGKKGKGKRKETRGKSIYDTKSTAW